MKQLKNFKFMAMLMFVALMGMSFTSCGEDEEGGGGKGSYAIVGKWQQTNDYGTAITITFKANKTGKVEYSFADGETGSYENFEYDYDAGDHSLFIMGNTQLAGTWYINLTANNLILKEYETSTEYYAFRRI